MLGTVTITAELSEEMVLPEAELLDGSLATCIFILTSFVEVMSELGGELERSRPSFCCCFCFIDTRG